MHDFLIKKLCNTDIESEIAEIGYDKSYSFKAKEKFYYTNLKIFNLTCAQNNILKQIALSVGADCATHRNVITGTIEKSDCIIGGSISQLKKIADKLNLQPFGLKDLSDKISEIISPQKANKTKIIGILNLTKDSFSDGGLYYEYNDSIKHLQELIADGADIIDIGAESTKPNSKEISAEEQLNKIKPILNYVQNNNIEIPISIDTRSAIVAEECIKCGAKIINDVSGLCFDSNMAKVIAKNPEIKIIIQHSSGTPENMQNNTYYNNLTDDIFKFLYNQINYAIESGIKKKNIIIDPGIGFGKTREQNLEIIKRWQELQALNAPILLGISRKSFLKLNDSTNEEKDIYTLAFNSILINENIDYIRVHNVKLHKKFISIIDKTY